jgi:hypothetical protein
VDLGWQRQYRQNGSGRDLFLSAQRWRPFFRSRPDAFHTMSGGLKSKEYPDFFCNIVLIVRVSWLLRKSK